MVEIVNPQDAMPCTKPGGDVRDGQCVTCGAVVDMDQVVLNREEIVGDDLLERANAQLRECGPHDFGLVEFGCACPREDHRLVIRDLRDALAAARGELADATGLVEQFWHDLGVREKRYAEMLDQRDKALHEVTAAREVSDAIANARDAARQDAEYWKGKYEAGALDALAAPATSGPEEAYRLDVAAVPGDGEQAARMQPLGPAFYDAIGMTHTGPTREGDGEQAATTSHGWTSHGYACCGEAKTGERPNARARCMGNPRCVKCKADAERIHAALPTSGQA